MIELSWLIGSLIAIAAGLWLVVGLRLENRNLGKSVQTTDRARLNARAYKEQLNLLKLRLADAEIDQAQFDEAHGQLEQTLLLELDGNATGQPKAWSNRPWSLPGKLALSVVVVGMALLTFQYSQGQQHFASNAPLADQSDASVQEMVSNLAQKLQDEPQNLQGWVMLGRSYSVMRRYADAADAYHQANKLTAQSEPELLVAEAEALGLAADQDLSGQPLALIHQALALDENNVRGLWYGLLAATQSGDLKAKKTYLKRLEAQPKLPDQLAELLRGEFSANLAIDQPESAPAAPSAVDEPVLNIQVDIAPDVRKQLPDNASLFVFAKAQQGPPMPLAVSRQPLPSDWPVKVRLDDSMGMMENMRLSSFSAWTVVARISASGMAQAQSGDWQASLDVDQAGDEILKLTLAQQLP